MTAGTPRIAPLPLAEWDDRLSRLLAGAPGGTAEPMHIFTTLAHQPELFRRWLGFGGALLAGRLSGRVRELVILRTAYRFDGRYEWAHHLELGAAQGITAPELAALSGDLAALQWDPFERAVLAAVDETADDGAVTDVTWSVLVGRLDDGELVELLMLVGHYLMLSTVLRSLRVPLEPSAEALAATVPGGPPA
ncbi:MAG TPA: carboxymuconolactone decarboxylase family protein [Acidimicrobiales bacterium]|nr:carboxymuconolactone decarboxylase family protein [Acidimicrobiales bacterium]